MRLVGVYLALLGGVGAVQDLVDVGGCNKEPEVERPEVNIDRSQCGLGRGTGHACKRLIGSLAEWLPRTANRWGEMAGQALAKERSWWNGLGGTVKDKSDVPSLLIHLSGAREMQPLELAAELTQEICKGMHGSSEPHEFCAGTRLLWPGKILGDDLFGNPVDFGFKNGSIAVVPDYLHLSPNEREAVHHLLGFRGGKPSMFVAVIVVSDAAAMRETAWVSPVGRPDVKGQIVQLKPDNLTNWVRVRFGTSTVDVNIEALAAAWPGSASGDSTDEDIRAAFLEAQQSKETSARSTALDELNVAFGPDAAVGGMWQSLAIAQEDPLKLLRHGLGRLINTDERIRAIKAVPEAVKDILGMARDYEERKGWSGPLRARTIHGVLEDYRLQLRAALSDYKEEARALRIQFTGARTADGELQVRITAEKAKKHAKDA